MADLGRGLVIPLWLAGCVMHSTLGDLDEDPSGETESGAEAEDDPTIGESATSSQTADDTGEGPELPPPSPDGWMVPEECAEVAAESAYCLTMDYEGATLVGIDTGRVCTFGASLDSSLQNPSFAWQGMSIVTCGNDWSANTVGRYDLITGEIDATTLLCRSVTDLGDRILVAEGIESPTLRVYDDFDAIVADAPAEVLDITIQGTRMWTDGEILLDAWHATDVLWRQTMDGEPLGDLPLQGYDGWIDGMFVHEGTLLVLTRGDGHDNIVRSFDPRSGAAVDMRVLEDLLLPQGLRCRPGLGR